MKYMINFNRPLYRLQDLAMRNMVKIEKEDFL